MGTILLDILLDNFKLARDNGPGFFDFNFNLILHISGENCGISIIRREIMPVWSDWNSEISKILDGQKC